MSVGILEGYCKWDFCEFSGAEMAVDVVDNAGEASGVWWIPGDGINDVAVPVEYLPLCCIRLAGLLLFTNGFGGGLYLGSVCWKLFDDLCVGIFDIGCCCCDCGCLNEK